MSSKRPRTSSPPHTTSGSLSQPSPESSEPVAKATRTTTSRANSRTVHNLLCTLPPTCNPPNRPTPLANSKELETHYATYHAHVCEDTGCGCVFPDARLLELHQTECHDPIAMLRKERGEKIFACHLPTCPRVFGTPKTRRLHLVQVHGYPKEYFFAVTNKGVGGLLKKWGEGASMIRGTWKVREGLQDEDDGAESDDGDDEVEKGDDTLETRGGEKSNISRLESGPLVEEDDEDDDETAIAPDASVDELAASMDTLSLVPPAIRFGRGAKRGGVSHYETSQGSQQALTPRNTRTQRNNQLRANVEVDSHGDRGSRRRGGMHRASQHDTQTGMGAGRRGIMFGRGRIAIGRGGGRGRG
ncbi:hypothetical protein BC835DRAFT_1406788 [Cytidiella melzeri]|nr:hypothetical protein BC835DRAFT_1406788 [Cytidiella melzeri]